MGLFQFKFTLRRLLINVTLLCTVLALAISFPTATRILTLTLLLYGPTIIVAALACYFSSGRTRTLVVVGVGALLGWLVAPRVGSPTFWDRFIVDFETIGMGTAGGAFLLAILDWTIATTLRPKRDRK